MRFLRCIFVLSMIFLCTNCKENIKETPFSGEIVEVTNPISISVEDFIINVDTIRLETTDESILDGILKMHLMDGRIYILNDKYEEVYLFSNEGKFIKKIQNKGDGPQEYIKINSFEVDKKNKKIILADSFSRRIFIYDELGELEDVIQLDFQPSIVSSDGKDGFISFYSGRKGMYSSPEMEKTNIHFMDKNGKINSYAKENETPQTIDISSTFPITHVGNGEVLYQPILSDTIFEVKNKQVTPMYLLRNKSDYKFFSMKDKQSLIYKAVGENSKTLKEKGELGYIFSWGSVLNLTDYCLFMLSDWDDLIYVWYDKNSKKSITVKADKMKGNPMLINLFTSNTKTADGNSIYISPNFFSLEENFISKLPEGIVKTYLSNTSFDDNPMIISYSIKFPQ